MLDAFSVKEKRMGENNVAGRPGDLMKVAYRLAQYLTEQVAVANAFRMSGQDPGCPLVGSERENSTSAARFDIGEQPDNKQALFRAVDCMREPVSVNVPARGREIVRPGSPEREIHRPQSPPSLTSPPAMTDELPDGVCDSIGKALQDFWIAEMLLDVISFRPGRRI